MKDARVDEIRQLLPQAMLPDWVHLGGRMVRLLRDQHHPQTHGAILDRLLAQVRASVALRTQRKLEIPKINYPPELPITARKDDIVAAIRANQVVVIAGETGSGKTTQIPKMCLEAGLGIEAKIGCTQPRRVAALSISQRIAEELRVTWGREVGCTIRFDDRSSAQTYIKLMTDGILLAETQGDPLLSEYNCIIIDEAHERSLNIDFLLGYLKGLLAKRSDLKLIITSATIDTQTFSKAFNDAPIIEVSGRLYPVEVIYAPFDAESEERGDITYVDAAVRAAETALCEPGNGDILIFMPGERDIRETCDLLEGRFGREAEIIPLFGLLSAADQQRVFATSAHRKIIVATNIAETSLTIPGIRYVIDSGLARISRYNPRTRTKRLPVEPVSQSSANQRKGRSGRVQDGVCIRLYSEEDFNERPQYTQPEIQRANLAEVILRMKAYRLGDIEAFPFVNPPPPSAIQGGYLLLQELGALDEKRELTQLGHDLSRLPIDPTLGRMLLQSQHEHAGRELLIIAAGLSIQDPRERPLDRKEAAAAAYKRFLDPQSDFLALLKIWDAVHDQWERLRSQGARRKFCKANFLSYLRMREWQDLHAQLHGALEDLGRFKLNESNADYAAIHRSILSGLLGHVAQRKERNVYQGTGNRQLAMFPGSALFDRNERQPKQNPVHKGGVPAKPASVQQPPWIVAGEIVETSQLFARTAAGIDPLWIIQLAPHLCKTTHQNPHWSVTAGNVLVEERTTLYGMELRKVKVSHGNINPQEATGIFIHAALVEDDLLPTRRKSDEEEEDDDDTRVLQPVNKKPTLPPQYAFLEHNHKVRQKIETWQTRVRRHDLANLDQTLFDFYAARLPNVSSVHELNRVIRDCGGPSFLCATEADLAGGQALNFDAEAFPDAVPLGGQPVALTYAYTPGEEQDGVTVKLGFSLAQTVSQASVEWSIPGLREGLVNELLRALPKSIRRELMPFPPKVEEILRDFQPGGDSLALDLAVFIQRRYGIAIPPGTWGIDAVPAHLRPRIEVIGNDKKSLGTSRDLGQLRQKLEQTAAKPAPDDSAWSRVAQQWERPGLTAWTFGELPERILVSDKGPVPTYAWPGLQDDAGKNVSIRLFRSVDLAKQATLGGIRRLVELALAKDFAWMQRDLRAMTQFDPLIANLCSHEELQATAYENLKRHILPVEVFPVLNEANFNAAVQQTRLQVPGAAAQLTDQVGIILKLRQEIQKRSGPSPVLPTTKPKTILSLSQLNIATKDAVKPANIWAEELEALLPKNFLEAIPFAQLAQVPRYLKALSTRMERAKLNPAKDKERAQQIAPYVEALKKIQASPAKPADVKKLQEEYRWMVEEFKVSLFAQELGTAFPVSPQRLEQQLQRVRV
ncbi:MAG TPA: ATP-dependent RNA helicase HrpA [Verrucomicrobiae bacterium]|nr:ATP-dependent RNA helicase HrpA [Verrucomicrobiae bacterium]